MITYKPATNILFWVCLFLFYLVGYLGNAVIEKDESLKQHVEMAKLFKQLQVEKNEVLKDKQEALEMYQELSEYLNDCLLSATQLDTEVREISRDLDECEEKIPTN